MYLLESSSNEVCIYLSLGNYSKLRGAMLIFPIEDDYILIETLKFKSLSEWVLSRLKLISDITSVDRNILGSNIATCLKKSTCYINSWGLK